MPGSRSRDQKNARGPQLIRLARSRRMRSRLLQAGTRSLRIIPSNARHRIALLRCVRPHTGWIRHAPSWLSHTMRGYPVCGIWFKALARKKDSREMRSHPVGWVKRSATQQFAAHQELLGLARLDPTYRANGSSCASPWGEVGAPLRWRRTRQQIAPGEGWPQARRLM